MIGIHVRDVLVRLRAISIELQVSAGGALRSLGVDVRLHVHDPGSHRREADSCDLAASDDDENRRDVQYHFNHDGHVRLHVGAGLSYVYFYNDKLKAVDTPASIERSGSGPA